MVWHYRYTDRRYSHIMARSGEHPNACIILQRADAPIITGMRKPHDTAYIQAALAAILFGASAPFSKLMLGEAQPVPLAALLYLGSGIGMLLLRTLRKNHEEARISRADLPWLAGAALAGGVAAPIVLLFSLKNTPAATASLLLNFEGVATMLIAGLLFREAIGRRVGVAILCITAASILLSWQTQYEWGVSLGALGIVLACALWGLDNNFTRNISAKDPTAIVMMKGLAAGAFSLALALMLGQGFPSPISIVGGLLLGSVSYGLSIMLFVSAMRTLGAVRTSALFGLAPFIGAALSLFIFRDNLTMLMLVAMPLMVIGAVLLVGEDHAHAHQHLPITHEHRHSHDDNHHVHRYADAAGVSAHSHAHSHPALRHAHAHMPDIHHRHDHTDDETSA